MQRTTFITCDCPIAVITNENRPIYADEIANGILRSRTYWDLRAEIWQRPVSACLAVVIFRRNCAKSQSHVINGLKNRLFYRLKSATYENSPIRNNSKHIPMVFVIFPKKGQSAGILACQRTKYRALTYSKPTKIAESALRHALNTHSACLSAETAEKVSIPVFYQQKTDQKS